MKNVLKLKSWIKFKSIGRVSAFLVLPRRLKTNDDQNNVLKKLLLWENVTRLWKYYQRGFI